ncbi:MAG TPA: alpha/beta hydrolase family protein [Blastocatellia bacterium]|nr:alpha/beta hydrolase family protein [Blastocatellia bacterium]
MRKKIARRDFLKQGTTATMIGATSLAHSRGSVARRQDNPNQYRGPVADLDVGQRQLDSFDFSLSGYNRIAPSMSFTASNLTAARKWQKQARAKLIELIGGFPAQKAPLKPVVLERKEFGGYVREKIIFQSRDDLSVFGYLLVPTRRSGPVPAVICLPGHGRGCDDIVGISEQGKQRNTKPGYAYDFALQVVENGYAAFAIEQLAFGCRRDQAARAKGAAQSSCQPAAGAALLFGQTMVAWRVWDAMRAIDYLSTRTEVDSSRLATMGISGGGTISLFTGAIDQRIKVAVVSCYFNTFRHSIMSLSHCIDNYVPGILNYLEMYDLAGLVAPRALFVESGTRDPIFPLEGSKLAFKHAQSIYSVFGVPEMAGQEVFEGVHEFHGVGAFEFLRKRL